MRGEISKILIKWHMPTHQVAINEILALFDKSMPSPVQRDVPETRSTGDEKWVPQELDTCTVVEIYQDGGALELEFIKDGKSHLLTVVVDVKAPNHLPDVTKLSNSENKQVCTCQCWSCENAKNIGELEHCKHPLNSQNKWEEEFDLLWGIAPPGTLKHGKGQAIKAFIKAHDTEVRKEERSRIRKWTKGRTVTKDTLRQYLNIKDEGEKNIKH